MKKQKLYIYELILLSEAKRSEKDTMLPKQNSGSETREVEPKLKYKSNRNCSQAADLKFKKALRCFVWVENNFPVESDKAEKKISIS